MRRALPTLVTLLAIGVFASPAQAGRWTALGTFTGPAVAAGDGRIVAGLGDHGLALVGPRGIERRYALGSACRFADVAGGGRAVLECVVGPPGGPVYEQVIDLVSGEISALSPGPEAASRLQTELYRVVAGIGRTWVDVLLLGNHYTVRRYWNPATGEVVADESGTRAVDLDATRPETPLCSPVVRPPDPSNGFDAREPAFGPFMRTGRFSVFMKWRSLDATDEGNTGQLYAWRCGQRKPVVVSRCIDARDVYLDMSRPAAGSCRLFDARDGLVAWPADRGVRLMISATADARSSASSPCRTPPST